MADVIVMDIGRHGMELESDELFVFRSDTSVVGNAQVSPFLAPEDGRMVLTAVIDLNVLGMVILQDPAQAVRARLQKAEGAFWALADFWKCANISFEEKAGLYVRRVRPCALYDSSTWT